MGSRLVDQAGPDAPRQKLTDAIARQASLPPGRNDFIIWDSDVTGLGLRLRTKARTWILVYRPVGAGRTSNSKRLKLASLSHVPSVSDARKLARIALGRIATGADPAAERAEQKRKVNARISELLDAYERDLERRGYVNRKVVMTSLRMRLAKYLTRDIRELTGAELARIIEGLNSSGKPGAAEDFRSRCRAFLTYCVTKAKIIQTSPLAGYRKERATRADRLQVAQHGRSLSDREVAAVWLAADPDTVFGRLVRFLILTGCRRGEGAGLAWAIISPEERLIRLPAEALKQGRDHIVPIAPALQDVLDACHLDSRSDLVFASGKTGGKISGWKQFRLPLCERSGVDFTYHDLRRTFRTGLSRLGVSDEIAELALGHARGKLEAIYNRDDSVAQLRKAFTLWADHVSRVVLSTPARVAAE